MSMLATRTTQYFHPPLIVLHGGGIGAAEVPTDIRLEQAEVGAPLLTDHVMDLFNWISLSCASTLLGSSSANAVNFNACEELDLELRL
jgi:hypothetical protein